MSPDGSFLASAEEAKLDILEMHFVLVFVAPSHDHHPLCDRRTNVQLIYVVTVHSQFADTIVANAELDRDIPRSVVVYNSFVRSLAEAIMVARQE